MTGVERGVSALDVLDSMDLRRGPLTEAREWEVESEWPSFSARFFLLSAGPDRVALKVGANWSGDLASFVAQETARVRELMMGLPAGNVIMPAVLGVSSDPPALALDYLDGEPLFDVIPRLDDATRSSILATCGQAIGAYHAAEPLPDDASSAEAARKELLSAARRARVDRATAVAAEPALLRSRGYRFSPNDFLIDGHLLVLLDPPHVRKFDYVHRDLGTFFMELHRSLVGERRPVDNDELGALLRAQGDFLEGYRETGPGPIDADVDRWAIDVFQVARIMGVARTRLRLGKIGAASRAVRWGMWIRRAERR